MLSVRGIYENRQINLPVTIPFIKNSRCLNHDSHDERIDKIHSCQIIPIKLKEIRVFFVRMKVNWNSRCINSERCLIHNRPLAKMGIAPLILLDKN